MTVTIVINRIIFLDFHLSSDYVRMPGTVRDTMLDFLQLVPV